MVGFFTVGPLNVIYRYIYRYIYIYIYNDGSTLSGLFTVKILT